MDAATDVASIGRELQLLRREIEGAFAHDTAQPGTRTGEPPSSGHCAVAALIVQAKLGGDLVSVLVKGDSHWFNRVVGRDGALDADVTGDQFGFPAVRIAAAHMLFPGARLRGRNEVLPETWKRAATLASRAGLLEIAEALARNVKSGQ